VAVSYSICFVLKGVLARANPGLLFSKNAYGFFFFSHDFFKLAFPSGHATTISAAAATFAYFFPRYSLLFVLLAIFMAFSRVVTGAHFLSDIFAGVLLGTCTAQWVCVQIAKVER
ncbi:MAG: phosphatase PAP2 family protein, partial [Chlamydiales bacterium]